MHLFLILKSINEYTQIVTIKELRECFFLTWFFQPKLTRNKKCQDKRFILYIFLLVYVNDQPTSVFYPKYLRFSR